MDEGLANQVVTVPTHEANGPNWIHGNEGFFLPLKLNFSNVIF